MCVHFVRLSARYVSDDRHTHTHVVSEKNQAKEPADLFLLPVRDCLHCSVIASAAGAYDVTALFLPPLAAFFSVVPPPRRRPCPCR